MQEYVFFTVVFLINHLDDTGTQVYQIQHTSVSGRHHTQIINETSPKAKLLKIRVAYIDCLI